MEVLQILASTAGLALGLTYAVGGLIVNLYLARYGITEYQIVRGKYLAAGLVYFINSAAVLVLSLGLALVALIFPDLNPQVIAAVSLGAAVALLTLWARRSIKHAVFRSWRFWVIAGALAWIFPAYIASRMAIVGGIGQALDALLVGEGITIGVLALTAQVYYYARHLYGDPNVFGAGIDPTGTGVVVRVQIAGDPEALAFLEPMGVSFVAQGLTQPVLLIDETDSHYIIGIEVVADIQAVKIDKGTVRAIRYIGYAGEQQPAPVPNPGYSSGGTSSA